MKGIALFLGIFGALPLMIGALLPAGVVRAIIIFWEGGNGDPCYRTATYLDGSKDCIVGPSERAANYAFFGDSVTFLDRIGAGYSLLVPVLIAIVLVGVIGLILYQAFVATRKTNSTAPQRR